MPEITYEEFRFPSSLAGENIFTRSYVPAEEQDIRGLLQITHGMSEHSALYDSFCRFMAENGFAVVINDHLAHGQTAKSGDDYGHFDKGGMDHVIEDMKLLHDLWQQKYPRKPYFLMGHSMGSFLAREYTARYPQGLQAVIYMGTARGLAAPAYLAEKQLLKLLIRKKGGHTRDLAIAQMATGGYNKPFAPNRTLFDWVTSDEKEVDRYAADPLCGFPFTLSGYQELAELLHGINIERWYRLVPKNLPILLISGEEDPVGGMGKGVKEVYEKLQKSGHTKVQMTLYPHIRHALVTEVNKEQVFADILSFAENNL